MCIKVFFFYKYLIRSFQKGIHCKITIIFPLRTFLYQVCIVFAKNAKGGMVVKRISVACTFCSATSDYVMLFPHLVVDRKRERKKKKKSHCILEWIKSIVPYPFSCKRVPSLLRNRFAVLHSGMCSAGIITLDHITKRSSARNHFFLDVLSLPLMNPFSI